MAWQAALDKHWIGKNVRREEARTNRRYRAHARRTDTEQRAHRGISHRIKTGRRYRMRERRRCT